MGCLALLWCLGCYAPGEFHVDRQLNNVGLTQKNQTTETEELRKQLDARIKNLEREIEQFYKLLDEHRAENEKRLRELQKDLNEGSRRNENKVLSQFRANAKKLLMQLQQKN